MVSLFDLFVSEYKEKYLQPKKVYENSLLGEVTRVKDALLDEKFKPSLELKNILNKQIKRAVYPMEVAIVGQFSSGKSTFLNALLSRDILPTGIVPVTSKVIYINYGERHKLKVTYKSGVKEYRPIEDIALFSDQRIENLEDIKYLTIYAPVEMLKNMSFVDTPGLNSQSQEDTQSTKKVFQDVGGIIWLTLMDNAGKRSEQEILHTYMSAFKTKSLCLLNQKDKFSQEQIETTTKYIENTFSNYFSKVIPISAKMALEARSHEPSVLIDEAMTGLIQEFKKELQNNPQCTTLKFFADDFTAFKKEVERIRSLDVAELEEKLEASNINDVLDYIDEVMSPNASEMKAFRIHNDLKNICDILINAYQTMSAVYDALSEILALSKEKSLKKLTQIDARYSADLTDIHKRIEGIFQNIATEIYAQISVEESHEFQASVSGFLKQEKIEKITFETFKIDKNMVLNTLFYQDQSVEKSLKKVVKYLEDLEHHVNEDLHAIYNDLQQDVTTWQHKYLLLSKNREISSDLEFSKVKRFASKVYENILNTYHAVILKQIDSLNTKIAYLNGALSYNLKQTVQVTVLELEEKILESEVVYLKDPGKFSIYKPEPDEILSRLKMNFDFEKLDEMLISQNSYLHRVIKESKKSFQKVTEEKQAFIEKEKAPKLEKIEALQKIKETIK